MVYIAKTKLMNIMKNNLHVFRTLILTLGKRKKYLLDGFPLKINKKLKE